MKEYYLVEPKSFTDPVGDEITVIGILMKSVDCVTYNLEEYKPRKFYIAFILSDGREMPNPKMANPTFDTLVHNLCNSTGMSESQAKVAIKQLISALDFGNTQQMYAAAQQMAGSYGYTLKPLQEQLDA